MKTTLTTALTTATTIGTSITLSSAAHAHSGHGLDGLLAHAAGHSAELTLAALGIALLAFIWNRSKN